MTLSYPDFIYLLGGSGVLSHGADMFTIFDVNKKVEFWNTTLYMDSSWLYIAYSC